ncbi:MAG: histidine triad nucleotide-binding protein [Opitutales bacterium]
MTLFEKIIAGEIPCDKVYEDENVFAFRDINPQAPTHILCVPKRVIARIAEATESDEALLGKLLLAGQKIAKQEKLDNGFRLVINNGADGGETVPHLHLHIIGGKSLKWVF